MIIIKTSKTIECSDMLDIEVNKLALEEIRNRMEWKAQEIFEFNAKRNPSYQTYNNLGFHYLTEGYYSKITKKSRDSYVRAEKCLNKSLNLQDNMYAHASLGELYLNKRKYKKAETEYKKALAFSDDSAILCNLGVSLYRQKKFSEASSYFLKAYNSNNNPEDKPDIFLSYGFSSIYLDDFQFKEFFDKFQNGYFQDFEADFDLIKIAYCFDEYSYILQHYQSISAGWIMELDEFKIIIHTLKILDKIEEAAIFYKQAIENLKDYNNASAVQFIKYYLGYRKSMKRKKKYNILNYNPIILYHCNYFGCSVHNNKWSIDE